MIHLTADTHILLATEPADFRQGIDGLARICQARLSSDPRSGSLFVFINRSKTMIRTLSYDGTGFWLMTKRLPEQHVMEKLRCNTCGAYFTATLPDDVLKDGTDTQKYGYSARALMAIYKYFAGLPFYRQRSIGKLLGVKITASTTFDQVEYVCNDINPVYQTLLALAGDAQHYYLDDTSNRILDQKAIEKPCRNSDKSRLRTGVYTSGVIATIATKTDTHSIVLFETNIGHAGEFIDSILTNRDELSAIPIIMSDALPSNKPSVREATISLCNSHARRQFVDVINHFPDEVDHVLARYGEIWTNEHKTSELALTTAERLAYHAEHSLPIMEEIKQWGETHLRNNTIEANSGLGKAITYFNKHYAGLSRFCTLEGCKLDNNRIEAMLKIIARDRKNAMFKKNLSGCFDSGCNNFNDSDGERSWHQCI